MKVILLTLAACLLTLGTAQTAASGPYFTRLASFAVNGNLPADADPATETSAEIITATPDGRTLIYSDSPLGVVGMIDIGDPSDPKPAGIVALDGEPTAVSAVGGYVLVGVNTSESFVEPSGHLAVVEVASARVVATCDLGGQPDSTAVAPDGSFVVVAIENERDEDLDDGVIPQLPAGYVAILALDAAGMPDCASLVKADVAGLAEVAPTDPEPEFVDVNAAGEIAVTLQENNHVVLLDRTGRVLGHFSAGRVDLEDADVAEDDALSFDGRLSGVPREPDAVQWWGTDRLVVANEGDYEGGSRGFTVFDRSGAVVFESGIGFEHQIALAGHYPEGRSENKGAEPEGMELATFAGRTYAFVLAERASVAGVYQLGEGDPTFVQLLPTGLSPEGAVAIPHRNLLAVSAEVDLGPDGAVRSHVTLYGYGARTAAYPTIVSSRDADGRPIGWGALSGLAADPEQVGILYAVNDSYYGGQPTVFTIDANQVPARIVAATRVTQDGAPAAGLDLEGIVADGAGNWWVASEGRSDRDIAHALYHVAGDGAIVRTVPFPDELLAHELRFGAEGITMVGSTLWIAIQREWGDDPAGFVKLLAYDTADDSWGAVHYPLEAPTAGWVGLSEITAVGDTVYVVERDNQIGGAARLKAIYAIDLEQMVAAPLGTTPPVVEKRLAYDLLPDLSSFGGYVLDKVEGFAIDAAGRAFVVTDNDGVDDSNGETLFFEVPLGGM